MFKGISLRFLCASFEQHSKVFPLVFQAESPEELDREVIHELNGLKHKYNCHLGIILCDSEFINRIGSIEDFILLSPSTSRRFDRNNNIFQLLLTEWEKDAVEKNLYDWGIDKRDVLVVSSFLPTSDALGPYERYKRVQLLGSVGVVGNDVKDALENFENYLIIGGTKQWKIIEDVRKLIGKDIKNKQIITTSSFEDWRIPAPRRKKLAKNIMYTYPMISDKGTKVIESFQKEFYCNPSIYQLLAYSATDIAIETLLKAGPVYYAIRKFLIQKEFENVISAKIGFSDHKDCIIPYTIGKSPQDIFQIKYVNKDGEYSSLNKEEQNESTSS